MKVFIGFDPRQTVAFQVCAQSVWEHASQPIEIMRLDLRNLPIKRMGLTQFTYSRFLVPYLSGFKGYSLFLDSDILVRDDVCKLQEISFDVPVAIVRGQLKFEWASVMYFNNEQSMHLTPEFVDSPMNKMYDWQWAPRAGTMPAEWNHLVGYDAPNPDARIVHFTKGIPIWNETQGCEFADEWWATLTRMNSSVSFQDLMGRSVHKYDKTAV